MSHLFTDPWVNIVDPADDKVAVRHLHWRSVRTLILRNSSVRNCDFLSKMCHLLSYCTLLNAERHIYALWMSIPACSPLVQSMSKPLPAVDKSPIKLKLLISLSRYMSNTTIEATLQHTTSSNPVYFWVQIFEQNAFNQGALLTLRIDRYGEYGELVWLTRGARMKGQSILNLCSAWLDYFKVTSCYLMDTAQITLSGIPFSSRQHSLSALNHKDATNQNNYATYAHDVSHKPRKGFLRSIHVLADVHGGLTWYEAHAGFRRIDVTRWPLVGTANKHTQSSCKTGKKSKKRASVARPAVTVTQSVQGYASSIEFLRSFGLRELIDVCLVDAHALHIKTMVAYYEQYTFDYDVLDQQRQRERDVHGRKIKRKRGDVDESVGLMEVSKLPLRTLHDLCRRVHCSAFYAPTKWTKVLGQRHLRVLYDVLLDPSIVTRKKHNSFLVSERGRQYLNALGELVNFRVFCRGLHRQDRIDGHVEAKPLARHQVTKFMRAFEDTVCRMRRDRESLRLKYEKLVRGEVMVNTASASEDEGDSHAAISVRASKLIASSKNMEESEDDDVMDCDEGEEEEEDDDEIQLSVNIRNKNKSRYKHKISIDSTSSSINDDYHEIQISVKSSRRRSRRVRNMHRRLSPGRD